MVKKYQLKKEVTNYDYFNSNRLFHNYSCSKGCSRTKKIARTGEKNEQERLEYQEWYNKLQSSRLFNKTITALFANGFPYELHFGHQNVCYTYDGDWSEYKPSIKQ